MGISIFLVLCSALLPELCERCFHSKVRSQFFFWCALCFCAWILPANARRYPCAHPHRLRFTSLYSVDFLRSSSPPSKSLQFCALFFLFARPAQCVFLWILLVGMKMDLIPISKPKCLNTFGYVRRYLSAPFSMPSNRRAVVVIDAMALA